MERQKRKIPSIYGFYGRKKDASVSETKIRNKWRNRECREKCIFCFKYFSNENIIPLGDKFNFFKKMQGIIFLFKFREYNEIEQINFKMQKIVRCCNYKNKLIIIKTSRLFYSMEFKIITNKF